jgi:hypothetical protein
MPGYARQPDITIIDEVQIFADSTERSSQVPYPFEGLITYLQDTNTVEYWDGSQWRPVGGAATYDADSPTGPMTGALWIDADGASSQLNTNDFLLKADAATQYIPVGGVNTDDVLLQSTMGVM